MRSAYAGYVLWSACVVWQCSCSYSSCFLSRVPWLFVHSETLVTFLWHMELGRQRTQCLKGVHLFYRFGENWTFVSSHELLWSEMLGTLIYKIFVNPLIDKIFVNPPMEVLPTTRNLAFVKELAMKTHGLYHAWWHRTTSIFKEIYMIKSSSFVINDLKETAFYIINGNASMDVEHHQCYCWGYWCHSSILSNSATFL